MFWRFSWDHLLDLYLLQIISSFTAVCWLCSSAPCAAQFCQSPRAESLWLWKKKKKNPLQDYNSHWGKAHYFVTDRVSAELVQHSGKRGWAHLHLLWKGHTGTWDGMALLKITVTVLSLALWFFCVWLTYCLKVFNYQVSFYLEWHVLIYHVTVVYTLQSVVVQYQGKLSSIFSFYLPKKGLKYQCVILSLALLSPNGAYSSFLSVKSCCFLWGQRQNR